jgi:hypothetical protein
MRRLLATAASGAVLLLGAGCSTEPTAAPAPTVAGAAAASTAAPGASAGPNAGDAALAANTPAICNEAKKVSGAGVANIANGKKEIADAAKSNADAKARAQELAEHAVDQWSYALGDLGKTVADAQVKKDLTSISAEVAKLKATVAKVDDAKVAALSKKVETACAGK